MEQINIEFGAPVDESADARLDREQVATNIGRIAKMLALACMMKELPTSVFDQNCLFDDSQKIREITKATIKPILGDEYLEFKDGEYRNYYPTVPDYLEKYVDYAGMIIAMLTDGVMAQDSMIQLL